ncbi:2-haloacid dehalogenase [Cnuella takakiae]|uniref:2-haloacid dehalogenase n=1 Tax=Cnuella takakiae TaxID=1302690 RepID=A0A1M5H4S1_9BACT|nr:HAD family phosphatase [Cnuella takakiae]OLY91115.1 HAD family hydrolase [Cnuella takakiae]SHG10905.1 2-haloacid dehalogenase [Cnuella takakiae]
MTQPKAIIFDLGNVLVDWNPDYLFRKIITDEERRKFFLTNICNLHWNELQDGGRTIAEGTAELLAQYPEWEEQIRAYYDRWTEMFNGPIEGTVEIFRQLKAQDGYKFYALTNWSAELFPIALELFPFFHWFDGRVVSGEEGMRKPDPAFFQLLLDRFGLQANEVLFIDDNLRNVTAAEGIGMDSIRFENPQQLQAALAQRGIVVNL